jgi:hypothetical protein
VHRRLRLTIAALAASSLFLAGCSSDDDAPDAAPQPSGEPSETAEAPAPKYWPLTGLEVKDKEEFPDHPVLVTKVDNTASSAPQLGLGSADLVVEELVEGGMTRLAVFYYSDLPKTVGPVRSMRASDIGIVSPAKASVVTSGAAGVTISRIQDAGIKFFGEGAPGVYRDTARSAPYNLFANLQDVAKNAKGKPVRDPYLTFGKAKDLPKGAKARTIAASFGGHTTNWEYHKGGYVNTNGYAADGDEFPTDTVLVLRVKIGDAGYRDPAGFPVPETKFEGKGQALLFHDGRVVKGTWSKDGLTGHVSLKGKGGELSVPAGHTWIELVPAGNGDVTFGK